MIRQDFIMHAGLQRLNLHHTLACPPLLELQQAFPAPLVNHHAMCIQNSPALDPGPIIGTVVCTHTSRHGALPVYVYAHTPFNLFRSHPIFPLLALSNVIPVTVTVTWSG
jgi:hypothetical protein